MSVSDVLGGISAECVVCGHDSWGHCVQSYLVRNHVLARGDKLSRPTFLISICPYLTAADSELIWLDCSWDSPSYQNEIAAKTSALSPSVQFPKSNVG